MLFVTERTFTNWNLLMKIVSVLKNQVKSISRKIGNLIFLFFFSVEQRPSDEQLLSHLEQIRRILLDAIVRHFDLQHEKRRRAKYHLRQLCLERTPIRQHCHGSMSNRKQAWDWNERGTRLSGVWRKRRISW